MSKKTISNFNKALDNYIETISAIELLPPRGDGAKDQVKKELKQSQDQLINTVKSVRKLIEDKYL